MWWRRAVVAWRGVATSATTAAAMAVALAQAVQGWWDLRRLCRALPMAPAAGVHTVTAVGMQSATGSPSSASAA